MFEESELLALSGLQHLAYCPRQWALIHLEQTWAEDVKTAEGHLLHERAHEPGVESRAGCRIARGLRIRSLRLGLSGQADVVEFASDGTPFPVEYKRGKPKIEDWDLVQLCAQTLCLEEMLSRPVPAGALYYHATRRRMEVAFDAALRKRTEALAAEMHERWRAGAPVPPFQPGSPESRRCRSCSLSGICLPRQISRRGVRSYILRAFEADTQEGQ